VEVSSAGSRSDVGDKLVVGNSSESEPVGLSAVSGSEGSDGLSVSLEVTEVVGVGGVVSLPGFALLGVGFVVGGKSGAVGLGSSGDDTGPLSVPSGSLVAGMTDLVDSPSGPLSLAVSHGGPVSALGNSVLVHVSGVSGPPVSSLSGLVHHSSVLSGDSPSVVSDGGPSSGVVSGSEVLGDHLVPVGSHGSGVSEVGGVRSDVRVPGLGAADVAVEHVVVADVVSSVSDGSVVSSHLSGASLADGTSGVVVAFVVVPLTVAVHLDAVFIARVVGLVLVPVGVASSNSFTESALTPSPDTFLSLIGKTDPASFTTGSFKGSGLLGFGLDTSKSHFHGGAFSSGLSPVHVTGREADVLAEGVDLDSRGNKG